MYRSIRYLLFTLLLSLSFALPAHAQSKFTFPTPTTALQVTNLRRAPYPTRPVFMSALQGQSASVMAIVDGDTIDVSVDGVAYRLCYFLSNTPERGQLYAAAVPCCQPGVGGRADGHAR